MSWNFPVTLLAVTFLPTEARTVLRVWAQHTTPLHQSWNTFVSFQSLENPPFRTTQGLLRGHGWWTRLGVTLGRQAGRLTPRRTEHSASDSGSVSAHRKHMTIGPEQVNAQHKRNKLEQDNVPQHKRNKLKQNKSSNFATVPAKTLHSLIKWGLLLYQWKLNLRGQTEVWCQTSENSQWPNWGLPLYQWKLDLNGQTEVCHCISEALHGQIEVCHRISESSPWPNWGLPLYQWKFSMAKLRLTNLSVKAL